MKSYKVGIYNNDKIIAARWLRAENQDEAKSIASWGIICQYPNVLFDDVKILEIGE